MECRYYLDSNPARTFANAERALFALSHDGIMEGEMVDNRYPGIIIKFNIETGMVNAQPIFTASNNITYLYADTILDVIASFVREGIACVARLFLFDELARITDSAKVRDIIKQAHSDAKGERINFELKHCRETQRRLVNEFKPSFSFLKTNQPHQSHIYKVLIAMDLNQIKCTHDVMAKVRIFEMGGGPRPAM